MDFAHSHPFETMAGSSKAGKRTARPRGGKPRKLGHQRGKIADVFGVSKGAPIRPSQRKSRRWNHPQEGGEAFSRVSTRNEGGRKYVFVSLSARLHYGQGQGQEGGTTSASPRLP